LYMQSAESINTILPK